MVFLGSILAIETNPNIENKTKSLGLLKLRCDVKHNKIQNCSLYKCANKAIWYK